jgi:23S rRNA (uracil1939-C5)-methyltransferase
VLTTGQEVEVAIEKAAAGGRMIARHDGQVVLVSGAIPGERVVARIERTERRLAFAAVVGVNEPSPDRRAALADPRCGGCVYSHIAYARQLALKADIVHDAFARLGRIPIAGPVAVAASPEQGYRMRARFHVDGTRAGFYREGTHSLCDATATGQLSDGAHAAVAIAVEQLVRGGARVAAVELAESLDSRQRALAILVQDVRPVAAAAFAQVPAAGGLVGVSMHDAAGRSRIAGDPSVSDPLSALTRDRVADGGLGRHAGAFFQSNRHLVPDLVAAVMDVVPATGVVLDLYAGVGLFSVALAGRGGSDVVAVEGDPASGADLTANARSAVARGGRLSVAVDSVERFLAASGPRADAVIVDPPRTGISPGAMTALLERMAPRLIYVSCDPSTMARDARRLLDGGYTLESLRAFDFFPKTAHVETLGVFVAT